MQGVEVAWGVGAVGVGPGKKGGRRKKRERRLVMVVPKQLSSDWYWSHKMN